MISFKAAAVEVLKKARKPLYISEITKKSLKVKGVKIKGKTPEATMFSLLNEDVRKNIINPRFIKVKPGYFALNSNFKEEKKDREKIQNEVKSEEKEETVIVLGQVIKFKGNKVIGSEKKKLKGQVLL